MKKFALVSLCVLGVAFVIAMVSIGIYTSVAIFYYHGYVEFVPYYTKIAEAKAQQAQLNLMPAVKSTQDLIAYDQRVVTKANTPLTIKLDGVG